MGRDNEREGNGMKVTWGGGGGGEIWRERERDGSY